jgi:predicted AlkP superfamily pyrophosphatase or phosphodiesterase
LLTTLKSDPKNRISAIADTAEVEQLGGNPEASFYVNLEADSYAGGFKGKDAPLVGPSSSKGMHGYLPTDPLMRSAFMMMGSGIEKGRNLGEIDMRAIAPTLAKILGVSF